jgi:hypothetical protein
MPRFRYKDERIPGNPATWWRWECPDCERSGELKLSREMAKKDAKDSHGYGRCPDGRTRR